MSKFWMSFLALILAVSVVAQVSEEERINELQKKVLEQQQILQDLEQKLQEREQSTQAYTEQLVKEYLNSPVAEEDAGITAGYDKGFFVQSADESFMLKLNGSMAAQAGFFEANTVTNNSFRLSEARIDFHAYLFNKDWHFRARPDFSALESGSKNVLRDVYLEYLGLNCVKFRVGAWVLPFSLEVELANGRRTIANAPFSSYMPNREIGAAVFGDGIPFTKSEALAKHLSYFFGVFNGEITNNKMDVNDDKMFMGQLKFFPFGNKEAKTFLQVAALFNNRVYVEDAARLNLTALWGSHRAFGQDGVVDVDDTNGEQMGVEVGWMFDKNNFHVEGEFIWMRYCRSSDVSSVSGYKALKMWGVSTAITYFIPVSEKNKDMGLEPVGKISFTDIDDSEGDGSRGSNTFGSLSDVRGQSIWEFTVGARFHFNKHVRTDFNWTMYDLELTRGVNNSDSRKGGNLIHAFLFQTYVTW